MTTAIAPGGDGLLRRMLAAARLDTAVYAEVAADRGATTQAVLVLAIATASQVVGDFIDSGADHAVRTIFTYPLGWALLALSVYVVARVVRLDRRVVEPLGLARTLAFAQAPLSIYVLAAFPALYAIASLATTVWLVGTMAAAIRGALGVGWLGAILLAATGLFLVVLAYTPFL